jgi:hypothetical protein
MILWFGFFVTACNKQTQNTSQNPVPSVPVNLSFYPNDPAYFKIQTIGGWMYVDGGINGLVLYRLSNEQFLAFERTSTQLPDNPAAKAFVQKDNFTLRDTVSGSEWRIIDGIVTKNPATWPLRQYGTNYDGNLLKIIN